MFDNIHPDFKETLDRFCADTSRLAAEARRAPDPAALAAAFSTAAVDFDVKAKNAGAEIIGHAGGSTLLIVAEKIAPVIDEEIETRKQSCVEAYWAPLQLLSVELHAALRLVRG